MRHTRDRQDTTQARGTELGKKLIAIYYKSPLGRIPDCMNKPFQVRTCYRTAKGSEIPVYCRVCPKPSFPSYHKKGMLPRLQVTIRLKAVSRLFGRMPHLQARSARAERSICRHISATLLNLQKINAKYDCIRCVYLFNFTSEYNCLRHGRNAVM